MNITPGALRDRIDPFLTELGMLEYRFGAGLASDLPLANLYSSFSEFSHPETFASIKEAAEHRTADPNEQRLLRRMLEFLAHQVEDALAAPSIEAIASLEGTGAVTSGTERIPFVDAVAGLSRDGDRHRRDAVEQAISQFLWEHQEVYARRWEAAQRAAQTLKYRTYLELREAVSRHAIGKLAGVCAEVLRTTEDAYQDVLSYALRKIDPALKPRPSGAARRHDLVRIGTAPWLSSAFRKEDLLPAINHWLSDMGFHASAQGRIQLDLDERSGKSGRPFVADIRVPDDIRLVVRLRGGLDDLFALTHEYGHAEYFANVSKALPVEDRRLGDISVPLAYGYLFDHVLLDERWYKRYLRLPARVANDAARMAAFANLMLLRRYCARLPFEVALYERGPVRPLAEDYEERLSEALRVGMPRGFYLYDIDPHFLSARYLRAWALESRISTFLTQRFNDDFWRNPATGGWLKELFARGQRDDAEAMADQLGKGELMLGEAARRLVVALNR